MIMIEYEVVTAAMAAPIEVVMVAMVI